MSSFPQIAVAGMRTVNAVWLAPILLFVVLAPQQTGAGAEILVLRASGRQLPPELIAIAIIGHASILWLPVEFFGLPWIIGGAAACFRDNLVPPARRRSYVEQANRFYGRSFALLILLGIILAALLVPLFAIPTWLIVRDEFFMAERPIVSITSAISHPVTIRSMFASWMVATVVVIAWNLIVAAMAIDDLALLGAIWRGLAFARDHRGRGASLAVRRTDRPAERAALTGDIPCAAGRASARLGAASYNAYAVMLGMAIAESLYLARRPDITAS